jgi:hypothetical protein
MRARSSIIISPIRAECQLVPHAVMMMLSIPRSWSCDRLMPPSFDVPSSRISRPRIVFSSVSGCSKISLSMKCANPPRSIWARSQSILLTPRWTVVALRSTTR